MLRPYFVLPSALLRACFVSVVVTRFKVIAPGYAHMEA